MIAEKDNQFMKIAIEQSQVAEENGDVLIEAVIVHKDQIVAGAPNTNRGF